MIPLIKPAVRLSPKHLWKNKTARQAKRVTPHIQRFFRKPHFAQIQVIGVLQHKTDWQLMLFSENQVSLAKAGDVIAAEHIQIEKIGKQHIDFLRWDNDPHCKATTPFQLKF